MRTLDSIGIVVQAQRQFRLTRTLADARMSVKSPQHFSQGGTMPHYLIQVAYSEQAWQALIKNPVNRIEAVRPAIENLGGKLQEGWFAFGDYDIVCIAEMPDNVAAAAIAIAFAGGGACKSVKTTPLMSTAEALEALKKASHAGYRAATA
jgi:uncharacterized protein with GYD domain